MQGDVLIDYPMYLPASVEQNGDDRRHNCGRADVEDVYTDMMRLLQREREIAT